MKERSLRESCRKGVGYGHACQMGPVAPTYLVEIQVVASVIGVGVEAGLVVGVGVPGAVQVIGHQVHEVEVLGHSGDVVRLVDGGLAGGYSGAQHHPVGVQSLLQVLKQQHEVSLGGGRSWGVNRGEGLVSWGGGLSVGG